MAMILRQSNGLRVASHQSVLLRSRDNRPWYTRVDRLSSSTRPRYYPIWRQISAQRVYLWTTMVSNNKHWFIDINNIWSCYAFPKLILIFQEFPPRDHGCISCVVEKSLTTWVILIFKLTDEGLTSFSY